MPEAFAPFEVASNNVPDRTRLAFGSIHLTN